MSYELMAIRGVSNHYGPRDTVGSDGFMPSAGLTRELVLEAGGPLATEVVLKKGWKVDNVTGITFKKVSNGGAYSATADTAFTEDVLVSVATGQKVITVTQNVA